MDSKHCTAQEVTQPPIPVKDHPNTIAKQKRNQPWLQGEIHSLLEKGVVQEVLPKESQDIFYSTGSSCQISQEDDSPLPHHK